MALTTLQKRAAALAMPCPVCPAEAGAECPGDVSDGLHYERRREALPEPPLRLVADRKTEEG